MTLLGSFFYSTMRIVFSDYPAINDEIKSITYNLAGYRSKESVLQLRTVKDVYITQ